jgi:hypothetical protein
MTIHDFQRAQLVAFAVQEAGPGACLDQMKAIAYCVRNRVRQGWFDGDWLKIMDHAEESRANLPGPRVPFDAGSRTLQRLIADIDEIYFSRRDAVREPSGAKMPDLEEAIGNSTYWSFINQPYSTWFMDRILADPKNHPNHATMGTMLFYE